MFIIEYPLPSQAGVCTVNLPAANGPGNWTVLGVHVRDDSPLLIVSQREAQPYRHDEREFLIVETGQEIHRDKVAQFPDYLGTFDSNGKTFHLFGNRTRPEGGKKW